MAYIAIPPVFFGHGLGFHQMPSRKVRSRNVPDFTTLYQIIQHTQRLFNRCIAIEAMHVVKVDIICSQPLQTSLYLFKEMRTGRPLVMDTDTEGKRSFRG